MITSSSVPCCLRSNNPILLPKVIQVKLAELQDELEKANAELEKEKVENTTRSSELDSLKQVNIFSVFQHNDWGTYFSSITITGHIFKA